MGFARPTLKHEHGKNTKPPTLHHVKPQEIEGLMKGHVVVNNLIVYALFPGVLRGMGGQQKPLDSHDDTPPEPITV